MSFYADEADVWKCPKHASKRRRSGGGVCPICLRDRLIALCPNCHDVRPCSCHLIASTSPFSLFSSSVVRGGSARSSISNATAFTGGGGGTITQSEPPSFLRSTSVALPLLRTKISVSDSCGGTPAKGKASLWWAFIKQNRGKTGEDRDGCDEPRLMKIRRSQSSRNHGGGGDDKSSSRTSRGYWNFSGGMNVFGRSKVVQEGPTLDRA